MVLVGWDKTVCGLRGSFAVFVALLAAVGAAVAAASAAASSSTAAAAEAAAKADAGSAAAAAAAGGTVAAAACACCSYGAFAAAAAAAAAAALKGLTATAALVSLIFTSDTPPCSEPCPLIATSLMLLRRSPCVTWALALMLSADCAVARVGWDAAVFVSVVIAVGGAAAGCARFCLSPMNRLCVERSELRDGAGVVGMGEGLSSMRAVSEFCRTHTHTHIFTYHTFDGCKMSCLLAHCVPM